MPLHLNFWLLKIFDTGSDFAPTKNWEKVKPNYECILEPLLNRNIKFPSTVLWRHFVCLSSQVLLRIELRKLLSRTLQKTVEPESINERIKSRMTISFDFSKNLDNFAWFSRRIYHFINKFLRYKFSDKWR